MLFGEFCLGLDRQNACVVLLPYEGGVMDQPLFEFQLWQIFLEEYTTYKIAQDKADAQKTKSSMGRGRIR